MTTENSEQTENKEMNNEENKTESTEQEVETKLAEDILNKQQAFTKAKVEGKTELESNTDGGTGEEQSGNEEGAEIDQTLVEAGRSVGMTDEQIIDMATDNPKALEALADAVTKSDNSDASQSEKGNKDGKTEKKPDEKNGNTDEELDLEGLDPAVAKAVKLLMDKNKKLEEQVTKSSQEDKAKQEEAIQAAINQDFDGMTEAFPVLGSSTTMTQAQFKLRESVLNEALALNSLPSSKRAGLTWPDCMKQAAANLLGKPKAVSKSKSENKSTSPDGVKKLFTQKPSGRKATAKKDGEKTQEQLVEEIATIQNSVR